MSLLKLSRCYSSSSGILLRLLFPVSIGLSHCVVLASLNQFCGLSVMSHWAAQEQGNPLSGGSPQVFEMVPGRMLGSRPTPLSSTQSLYCLYMYHSPLNVGLSHCVILVLPHHFICVVLWSMVECYGVLGCTGTRQSPVRR